MCIQKMVTEMDDFEKWYNWQLEYGEKPVSDKRAAEAYYNNIFDCDCETCRYRREHGFMPVKLSDNCRLKV